MAMEANTEQSANLVMTIEAVLKQPALTVPATEVMFKQPVLPVMATEAVPEQPAVITTQANPEQPVLLATDPVQEPPESTLDQEYPEFISVAQEGAPQSVPPPVSAAQESTPESSPMSVPEFLESASKSVPKTVLVPPEPVPQGFTLLASAVMASEFVPRSFTSQELAPKTTKAIFKTPPVKQAHVSRRNTNKFPIPPSLLPRPYEFAKPEPPWSATNYFPGVFSSPVQPPLFTDCPGTQIFRPSLPSQLVPPLTNLPSVDAWRRSLGGGYCQDPALSVLSVLLLFNVSLFVLCLSTWLCLCLCLPCAPLVPPPCFPWSRPLV